MLRLSLRLLSKNLRGVGYSATTLAVCIASFIIIHSILGGYYQFFLNTTNSVYTTQYQIFALNFFIERTYQSINLFVWIINSALFLMMAFSFWLSLNKIKQENPRITKQLKIDQHKGSELSILFWQYLFLGIFGGLLGIALGIVLSSIIIGMASTFLQTPNISSLSPPNVFFFCFFFAIALPVTKTLYTSPSLRSLLHQNHFYRRFMKKPASSTSFITLIFISLFLSTLVFSNFTNIVYRAYNVGRTYFGDNEKVLIISEYDVYNIAESKVPNLLEVELAKINGIVRVSSEIISPCEINGSEFVFHGVNFTSFVEFPILSTVQHDLDFTNISQGIFLGANIASLLNIETGDVIEINNGIQGPTTSLQVQGIYRSHSPLDDEILAPIDEVISLYDFGNTTINFIQILLADQASATSIKQMIMEIELPGYRWEYNLNNQDGLKSLHVMVSNEYFPTYIRRIYGVDQITMGLILLLFSIFTCSGAKNIVSNLMFDNDSLTLSDKIKEIRSNRKTRKRIGHICLVSIFASMLGYYTSVLLNWWILISFRFRFIAHSLNLVPELNLLFFSISFGYLLIMIGFLSKNN